MGEYDRKCEVYEYGYQLGHRALLSLRPGESFVREAGNRGLHVNGGPGWHGLKAKAPEADLVYLKDFFPGYNGGMVGNGIHRYAPDIKAAGLAVGPEAYENLTPALQLKDSSKPGVAIVPIASPYIYLGGKLKLQA